MEELIKAYINPRHPGSFGGVERLRRATLADKEDVEKALQHTDTYTIGKETRRRFPRNRIIVTNMTQQFQVDLADMTKFAPQNDNVKFLLVAIDCFSRKASVKPLLNKSAIRVKDAMNLVLQELGIPDRIQFDKGKEFINKTLTAALEKKGVKMITAENDDIKCSMAERLIRTIKSRIYRFFRFTMATRYIDRLQDFVHSYNHSEHKAHGQEPASVSEETSLKTFNRLYGDLLTKKIDKKPRYKVGDAVRMSKNKLQFEKGYEDRFMPEICIIAKVIPQRVPIYELSDPVSGESIKGNFYEPELSLVRDHLNWEYKIEKVLERKRQNRRWMIKVRWLGYNPASDSWIPEQDARRQGILPNPAQ